MPEAIRTNIDVSADWRATFPLAQLCPVLNALETSQEGISMIKTSTAAAFVLACSVFPASAQTATPLTQYVDANGFLDVQTLTCAQLADTYQEDADALTAWYSGWYNGLAHKHFLDYKKGREVEHEVIVYCKANREKKLSRRWRSCSRTTAPSSVSR